MCMYLNDNAINYSKTGAHRLVTKEEEAYEILRRAEDNGLVHEINQTPGFEDTTAICNCCGCSCFALRIAEYFRSKNAIRSNFLLARVDKESASPAASALKTARRTRSALGRRTARLTRTYPTHTTPTGLSPGIEAATTRSTAPTAATSWKAARPPARPPARRTSPYRAT